MSRPLPKRCEWCGEKIRDRGNMAKRCLQCSKVATMSQAWLVGFKYGLRVRGKRWARELNRLYQKDRTKRDE